MTNAELLAKIKAEIERLKGICKAQIKANPGQTFPFVMEMTGYDKILSSLDSLEPEKPMNLEEAFESEFAKFSNDPDAFYAFPIDLADYKDFAHHFFEIGCRRTAEKYDEIEYNRQRAEESVPNGLEEAALSRMRDPDMYLSDAVIDEFGDELLRMALFGAEWQKERMMKEAVEGEVKYFRYLPEINYSVAKIEFAKIPDLKEGDNVRVIVMKKED